MYAFSRCTKKCVPLLPDLNWWPAKDGPWNFGGSYVGRSIVSILSCWDLGVAHASKNYPFITVIKHWFYRSEVNSLAYLAALTHRWWCRTPTGDCQPRHDNCGRIFHLLKHQHQQRSAVKISSSKIWQHPAAHEKTALPGSLLETSNWNWRIGCWIQSLNRVPKTAHRISYKCNTATFRDNDTPDPQMASSLSLFLNKKKNGFGGRGIPVSKGLRCAAVSTPGFQQGDMKVSSRSSSANCCRTRHLSWCQFKHNQTSL